MEKAMNGVHGDRVLLGVGRCLCLYEDDGVVMEFQCCWASPGQGQVLVSGNMSQATRDSIDFVRHLVTEHRPAIAAKLGVKPGALPSLVRPYMDLHVHCEKPFKPVEACYNMPAAYVAMVSLLFNRQPRWDTVVFGDLNNYGYMSSDWRWRDEMLNICQVRQIRRVVLAQGTIVSDAVRAAAAVAQDDGKPLVELIFLESDIVSALHYFF